jgi:hypothetical protein
MDLILSESIEDMALRMSFIQLPMSRYVLFCCCHHVFWLVFASLMYLSCHKRVVHVCCAMTSASHILCLYSPLHLPQIQHFRNTEKLKLQEGMIFTIEPMFTAGDQDCREWADDWTVVTVDGSVAAQFEHTVLITSDGVEILTLPESEWTE